MADIFPNRKKIINLQAQEVQWTSRIFKFYQIFKKETIQRIEEEGILFNSVCEAQKTEIQKVNKNYCKKRGYFLLWM